MIELRSSRLLVSVDEAFGGDVLRVVDLDGDIDMLFSTPWADTALEVRSGFRASVGADTKTRWFERYAGGWQVLSPNAGEARTRSGSALGYHGESAIATWRTVARTPGSVRLATTLFTAPLAIERTIRVRSDEVSADDRFTNVGLARYAFDVLHHPALNGDLFDERARVVTDATTFTNDEVLGWRALAPGSTHPWPEATGVDGLPRDLSRVSRREPNRAIFGWLSGFDRGHVTVELPSVDRSVWLDWDATVQPNAWFWQELGGSTGWPWFARARTVAIEPASMSPLATALPGIELDAGASISVPLRIRVHKGTGNG